MTNKKQPGMLGAGLWIVPLLTFLGSLFFGAKALISRNSGSTSIDANGIVVESAEKVPFHEIGFFWFAVGLFIATFVILAAIKSEK